jgi:hypothetical protein
MESSTNEIPLVLTRYLYIKHDVYASLLMAILQKDYDQALFWGCELYYSGWKSDACSFVFSVYCQWFKPLNHPGLYKYMDDLDDRCEEGAHILATMIKNITMPWIQWTSEYFLKHQIDTPIPSHELYKKCTIIKIESYQVDHYKTVESTAKLPPRKLLQHVCQYSTEKQYMEVFGCIHTSIPNATLVEHHRSHWLYYACMYTPLWIDRLREHRGELDTNSKTVCFADDDCEAFEAKYDYDLDEQPLDVQEKLIHIRVIPQCTQEQLRSRL